MTTSIRTSLLFVAAALTAGTSQAQIFMNPGQFGYGSPFITWQHHASTAAEGYMQGQGALIRSQGWANWANSAAAINYSVARRNEIDNRQYGTKAYFNMREMNRQARASERGPRLTEDARTRLAKQAAPDRLSPSELDALTGQIQWPTLLQYDSLAQKRAVLDSIFAGRASQGTISATDYTAAQQTISSLLLDLKAAIDKVSPTQYVAAKQFLDRLQFEANQPVQ